MAYDDEDKGEPREKSVIISRFSIFTTLFKVNEEEIRQPTYKQEYRTYMKNSNSMNHLLVSYIMNFSNKAQLNWVGEVLGVRLMENEKSQYFDVLKEMWNKLFGYELKLANEFETVERWEYVEAIKSLSKMHDNNQPDKNAEVIPPLPSFNEKNKFYLQQG